MFEAIIFVSILFVFLTTFIFWCCENKRDLDTRIIGGAVIVYCFISVFTQMYLLPILEIIDWDKRISLQMQLTALAVGLTAAIIAFRNYRRKSGQDVYYAFLENINIDFPHMSKIVLYNNKDRATVVFAVDIIMLDNGSRIRLFQDNMDPVIVSAYSSILVDLDQTFNYTNEYMPDEFLQEKMKLVCITLNGEIIAKSANVDMLRENFRDACIFPLTVINIPNLYNEEVVPRNATHWITLIESKDQSHLGNELLQFRESNKIITGYYQDDVLYITPEPEADCYLKEYLHGKTRKQIQEIVVVDNERYKQGYFSQEENFGVLNINEIEFTEVTKQ